jgi:hypothetical protein
MGRLVQDYCAGMVVPPDDSWALAKAMLDFEHADVKGFTTGMQALSRLFDVRTTAKTWLSYVHRTEDVQERVA